MIMMGHFIAMVASRQCARRVDAARDLALDPARGQFPSGGVKNRKISRKNMVANRLRRQRGRASIAIRLVAR